MTLFFRRLTILSLFLMSAVFQTESSFAAEATAPSTSAPVVAAQVVWVKGMVQAISTDQKTRELHRRDLVHEQDILSTEAGGSGQIVFSDGTLFTLNESTKFKIDQYRYVKGDAKQEKYVVSVLKGGFRTVTGLISKDAPDSYKVQTPVATIGVRGTEIVGYIDLKGHSAFAVPKGLADFKNEKGTFVLGKERLYAIYQTEPFEISSTNQLAKVNAVRPEYTAKPSDLLKDIPQIEQVKPSPELIRQSIKTSVAAVNPPLSTNPAAPTGVVGTTPSAAPNAPTGTVGSFCVQ